MQEITESEKRLLDVLLKNSRTPIAKIGDQIGKGRNWISRAIRNLVKRGDIKAYVTILDPAQVFAERNTILLIKTNPREIGVSAGLLEMPELESLDGISGNRSLLGLFRFRGDGAFEEFLDRIDRTIARSRAGEYQLVQVLATYKSHGFVIPRQEKKAISISPRDWELISVLSRHQPDERNPFPLTQSQIGERMRPRLSQPAVSKAMQRLEEQGVIIGYTIEPHFGRYGLPIKFFLEIKTKPGKIAETANYVGGFPEVWDLHRTGEDFSLFATIRTPSVEEYNTFIRRLYENPHIVDTHSIISLEEWFVPVNH